MAAKSKESLKACFENVKFIVSYQVEDTISVDRGKRVLLQG